NVSGTVTNTGTATGALNDPSSTSASASASATVTGHTCGISVTKTPAHNDVCNGSSVTYTYSVTNNSDQFSWTGSLSDNILGDISGGPFTLAAGASQGFTATGTISGQVDNTATATGAFNDPSSSSASSSVNATVNGHNCSIT